MLKRLINLGKEKGLYLQKDGEKILELANEMEKTVIENFSTEDFIKPKYYLNSSNINFELFSAAEKGDIDKIKFIIEKGYKINKTDKYGEDILMICARNGNLEIIKLIIDKFDINRKNKNGHTSLMIAVFNNKKDVVIFLIEKGANLSIKNNSGGTVVTASLENLDIFETIIKSKSYNFEENSYIFQNSLENNENNLKILSCLIEQMTRYYKNIHKKDAYNFELAINRIHSPIIFNYNQRIKEKYVALLRSILKYIHVTKWNLKEGKAI